MTATVLYPNNDLVAVAFLKAVLGWEGNVGTELPGDESWVASGFVQATVVCSTSNPNLVAKAPVISVKCWARNAGNSRRPPRDKANNLAETIRASCFHAYQVPVTVTLPGNYPDAHVRSAYLLGEPIYLPNDPSSFACYQFNLQLKWTAGVGKL